MAFTPAPKYPQFADLLVTLAQSKDQDSALYQTIEILIERLTRLRTTLSNNIEDIAEGTGTGEGSQGPPGTTGPEGPPGPEGAANLDYLGGYVPIVYNKGDIVVAADNITYMCVKDGTPTPPEPWPSTSTGLTHHTTHETGGSDAITSLSGSVIISGTVVDARLSSNVALRNNKNYFSEDQFIQKPGASIRMIDTNSPVNQKLWVMGIDVGPDFFFQSRNDDGSVRANAAIFRNSGDVNIGRDIYEKGRTVPVGHWTPYTCTWATNVAPPTLGNGSLTGKYTVIGRTVLFEIFLYVGSTTSIGNDGVFGFSLPIPSVSQIGGSIFIYNAINGQTFTGTLFWGNQLVGGAIAGMVGCIVNGGSLYPYAPFLTRVIPFNWNAASGTQCIIIGSYSI